MFLSLCCTVQWHSSSLLNYNLIVNNRKKIRDRMRISYDLCTPAIGQGAGDSGSISSSWQASVCVLNPLCSSCRFHPPPPPHPLGPLPVLNSMASWPKHSIFSLVSPVQPLDRITHIYYYTKTPTISLICIYICRIKKKETAQKRKLIVMPDLFKSVDTHFS